MRYTGIIEHYKDRLAITKNTKIISLGEGNTPLIQLNNIAKILNFDIDIYAKYEGLNPTGSFKDRGMTMAVTKAIEHGSKAVICASTGNTSASAAAYACRAGIKAFVIIPKGKIAMGKLAQTMMYGANILQIKGNFDTGMSLIREVAEHTNTAIVNSINPYRLQGQKTAAFEIVDELGFAPDYHFLPVGNAGNISAYWMGYKEANECDKVNNLPIMVGYQAQGAAPFIKGKAIDNPQTIATAIRIGNPQSYELAVKAKQESGGWFGDISDDDILAAQKLLSSKEGIFCEPASAASLAGVIHSINNNKLAPNSTVVCTLTGNGLKDPDIATSQCQDSIINVDSTIKDIKNTILARL